MKIRFLQDRVVQDANTGTPKATVFKKGQTVDVADGSANHWITRGVAEAVGEEKKPAAEKKPAEK